MNDPLAGLEAAVTALRSAWAGRADAAAQPADALAREQLVRVTDALGAVGRQMDAVRAQVAAEIDRQSRRELGADSLAKQQGFRNASALIAAATGLSTGDAARLTKVGKAVAPRMSLSGQPLPAQHPHVAAAVHAGKLTAAAADVIISMLDRVAVRASVTDRDMAEHTLACQAPGLPLDAVRKLAARAEAWLDQDGLEPAERDRRGERYLRLWEKDGMLHLDAAIDVVTGAPLKTAIEALVTASFRQTKDDVTAGDDDAIRPTVSQLQADALVQLAEHALGCDRRDLPLEGVSVVVRVSLETLQEGTGTAEIDGVTQLISPSAARHLAASAGIIPCMLDSESEILDWGRVKRLFTPAQRLVLVERDGGCAMCNLPPGMTKAHHIRWWAKDAGPTDVSNGVLLCESCHHRIHDNGWDVRVDGIGRQGRVWFTPPATVDPTRTPRLGGRARFEFAPAA